MHTVLKIHNKILASLSALLIVLAPVAKAGDKDPIADYQADLSPGAVSAGEMLGLSGSAVSSIQAPKDFVAALNALSSDSGKAGFGLSFTPGRTRFAPVSIADYRNKTSSRVWAGTSISYAQNTNTQGGVDYRQEAYALHVAYYLNPEDDPAVAGNIAFGKCDQLQSIADARANRLIEIRKELRNAGVSNEDLNEQAKQRLEKEKTFISAALPAYKACVDGAIDTVKKKWNAGQVAITLGEGTIHNPATGSQRLSLGRSGVFAIALGPNPDSLVNVTLRRTSKALELSSIATTPTYKTSNLVGARWTYRALDTKDLYALAEVSNATASSTTASNVFKYALGVDKRLAEGIWLELRLGRNHTQDGKTEQSTALMSLKFSPKSYLAP